MNKRVSQRTKLKIAVAQLQKSIRKADKLCRDFYRDFHGVMNRDLVTNDEIGHGAAGTVS